MLGSIFVSILMITLPAISAEEGEINMQQRENWFSLLLHLISRGLMVAGILLLILSRFLPAESSWDGETEQYNRLSSLTEQLDSECQSIYLVLIMLVLYITFSIMVAIKNAILF